MDQNVIPTPSQGRVQRSHSNFYYVALDLDKDAAGNQQGDVLDECPLYECSLRGLLKKERTEVLVGDRVTLDALDPQNNTGRIQSVLPRQNRLERPKIANVDRVVIVHPFQEPDFDGAQLDRYLTQVAIAGIEPVICLSKTDLAASPEQLNPIHQCYSDHLGYRVFNTSVYQPESFAPLLSEIKGKMSVLAGLSGAGKSSLLNAVNPSLDLKIKPVSEALGRGQHTTRHVELLTVATDTVIADTPGFSQLKFDTVLPNAIEAAYREFAPYREACEFSDCLHIDESGCAVLANIEALDESRYQSYLAMIEEARSYKRTVQQTSQKEDYGSKTLHRRGQTPVEILRLKGKDREASRRTRRQQVSADMDQVLAEEPPDSL
ncbi:MAG: ribosome small subunit-dependent GTPase A [Vampirovibrio sp.]|nr:ribosome small subunit-dependent GTPase A [Vampirovibrio sp.]